jgi:hypothetical protein
MIHGILAGCQFDSGDTEAHRSRDRLCDRPLVAHAAGPVRLDETKLQARPVAPADVVVERAGGSGGEAGLVICPVLPPKAVELPVARLEEVDDGGEIVE